jgi:hypothetical protein
LWATAHFDLGLSDEELGVLTPRMFHALLKRKQMADREAFLRTGMIASAVINYSMGHPEKPVSPMEFVPGGEQKSKFDLRELSPEGQKAYIIDAFSSKKMKR